MARMRKGVSLVGNHGTRGAAMDNSSGKYGHVAAIDRGWLINCRAHTSSGYRRPSNRS